MFKKIIVEKNLKENIQYRDATFPIGVWKDDFNEFLDHTINCHWHYDFEYGYVLSGSVDYFINDTHIKLQKGDCVFVNSNRLHMMRQPAHCDNALMFSITFPPSLLTAHINGTVHQKYFQPLLNKKMEGIIIRAENTSGQEIISVLAEIYTLNADTYGSELQYIQYISQLWFATLRYVDNHKVDWLHCTGKTQHTERAKEILSYIQEHYNEKITIDIIAKRTGISRSECFRCFKRFMNKKPMEYVNEYRLTKAARLLEETEKSITAVYMECGFTSASYFGIQFKGMYGVTPLQYRRSL